MNYYRDLSLLSISIHLELISIPVSVQQLKCCFLPRHSHLPDKICTVTAYRTRKVSAITMLVQLNNAVVLVTDVAFRLYGVIQGTEVFNVVKVAGTPGKLMRQCLCKDFAPTSHTRIPGLSRKVQCKPHSVVQ